MITNKEMEFAKLLISKELISRAEMQRHLDELTRLREKGEKISLEEYLIKNDVINEKEIKYLKAKKRIVHCSKCKTMYRVTDEDIGKRFKCKKCGVILRVPRPGETQVKRIKEIKQEIGLKSKEPELKLKSDEIDTQKIITPEQIKEKIKKEENEPIELDISLLEKESKPKKERKKEEIKQPQKVKDTLSSEVTIMVGLDDKEGDIIDLTPLKKEEIREEIKKSKEREINFKKDSEFTIMLGIDEENIEPIEIFYDKERKKEDKKRKITSKEKEKTEENIEDLTIMLGIDEENKKETKKEKKERKPKLSDISKQKMKKDSEFTIMLDIDEDDEEDEEEDTLEEWAISGYGGEGSENIEIKTSISQGKKEEIEKTEEETSLLNSLEVEEWAISGYGGEGSENIEIKTIIPNKDDYIIQQKDYKIVRILGRGILGNTYEAILDGVRLVVKEIDPPITSNPNVLEKLKKDIFKASSLHHPNIIPIYELNVNSKGIYYYTMKYIDKVEKIKDIWPKIYSNEEMIIKIALQIADALSHIHSNELIHEYLDWENILLVGEKPYLQDVGIFALHNIRSILLKNKKKLNPLFMSPEKLESFINKKDIKVDERTDIYSLGILLYWMVTQQPPFPVIKDLKLLMKNIKIFKPLPPIEIEKNISTGLSYIIMKCIEANPNKRYQTIEEVSSDLSELLK